MKTVKLIIVAIFSFAILNSCTDNSYSDNSYSDNDPKWFTQNLEVKAGDWKHVGKDDEIGSYYEYVFDGFPYVDGIINVYLYQNFGARSETQTPLPYTYYGVEVLENGKENYYSIQYSYDIAIDGTIALKIHVSDYYTSLFDPGTEYFRVAITW
ncbi:MAG: hypothetical protein LBH60_07605 [Prevotellaceae bacterium]|jgi:hypothetical protein|nr:hypothetical protein [Prevotellaceae bacterium]